MSEIKVNKISPRTSTDVTVGGKLITESNGDLNLYPNGTGAVEIGGNTNPGTIILNCESNSHGVKIQSPAHSAGQSYTMKLPTGNITAGKFLKVDSISGSGTTAVGQLSFADVGGGIEETDQYRLTANITSNTDPISANLERVDDASFGKIGTGMSVSSGIFTFPATGLYQVMFTFRSLASGSDTICGETWVTQNNSSYDLVAQVANGDAGSSRVNTGTSVSFINVTNTTNVKVKFAVSSLSSGAVEGDSDLNLTCFSFIRLGDSV